MDQDEKVQLPERSSNSDNENIETEVDVIKQSISKKRKRVCDLEEEFLEKALDLFNIKNENKDEASIFAESWAVSYRKLDSLQQLYAKKAIDDILILGQLNKLTLNTVAMPSAPILSLVLRSPDSKNSNYYQLPSTSRMSTALILEDNNRHDNVTQISSRQYASFEEFMQHLNIF